MRVTKHKELLTKVLNLRSLFINTATTDLEQQAKIVKSFKAKANAQRTPVEKLADWATNWFGSISFLTVNVVLFTAWVLINTGQIETILQFDPFPFILLTTIVSLEAIILAIFVLISQNRAARIDDLREEIGLQLDIIMEKEITKVMKLLARLLEAGGIDINEDPELKKMLRPTSPTEIQKKLEKEIR